ncbi:cupin domain-containing protein [Paenibacillus nanensis]|uniref:Cupin domain-containing protein n=1 Tax=Paenibacillus nanensis TaxID=393251 RepID=A0A3A1UKQ8_9BACL|nr:cupin domain-containing protein [Paenibacillus nanensis]RIX47269.1 cupin domain-containing protein [Paenibacillus nanensis]
MATSYMDFTAPTAQFTYTLANNPFFRKDDRNVINSLSVNQLNTLGNASLLDIFLSKSNVVEPHIHQNATELVYCVSGAAVVSIINPFTKELLNFPIAPGQVANVPQGWWHYEIASEDNTHLIAIFDAPVPQVIFGSDILRLTPASVLAHSYCLDEAKVKDALAPLTETVVIGPPNSCNKPQMGVIQQITNEQMQGMMSQGMMQQQSMMNQGMMNQGGMQQGMMQQGMQQGMMQQGMAPSGMTGQASQTAQPPFVPGSYGGVYQDDTAHYPFRPIASDGYNIPLDYPFHPIPFLYRSWNQL